MELNMSFQRAKNGRESKLTIECPGSSPLTLRVDLTDDASRGKAVARIVQRFPAIDVDDLHAKFDEEAAHKDTDGGTITDRILAFLDRERRFELFHTPDGVAFAWVVVRDALATAGSTERRESLEIRSTTFREWMTHEVYVGLGKPPSAESLAAVTATLAARARFSSPEMPAEVRIAGRDGAVWLDLANDAREFVRVDSTGWEVIPAAQAPVRLVRRSGMHPLPRPERGGSIDELRRFVNLGEQDWILLRGFVLMLLSPTGPFPILVVTGEQGSAKSTLSKVIRRLVDPNRADARRPPRESRDLAIAAMNSRLIVLDNLSDVPPWLGDDLCAFTSGNGFATRALHTDGEEAIFQGARPVILNGIDDLAVRGDIQDRAILLDLKRIDDAARLDEREFWAQFETARPRILGALLDALATALARRDAVKIEQNARLADFGLLVEAGAPGLGLRPGEFLRALFANRARSSEIVVESSPFAFALHEWMADRDEWCGTAGELLDVLSTRTLERRRSWPATPRKVGDLLRRFAPALRQCGIEMEFGERGSNADRARLVRIRRSRKRPSTPSRPSESVDDLDGPDDAIRSSESVAANPDRDEVARGRQGGSVDAFD